MSVSGPPDSGIGLRVVAGLGAAALVCNGGLAYLQRAMLGFPDGFRGPADTAASAAYLAVIAASAVLAIGLAAVAARPARPAAAVVAALAGLGAAAIGACVAVEPIARAWWPSTGG